MNYVANQLRRQIRRDVYDAIFDERGRQDSKWGWPNEGLAGFDFHKKNTILGEEVGEVARALLEDDYDNLKEELVQVAAVCVAWLEAIHQREAGLL